MGIFNLCIMYLKKVFMFGSGEKADILRDEKMW